MIIIMSSSSACLDVNRGPNEKTEALSNKARHDRHQEEHEESEDVDEVKDNEEGRVKCE